MIKRFLLLTAISFLFTSCLSVYDTKPTYGSHLKSHRHDNFRRNDNGGCGWSK